MADRARHEPSGPLGQFIGALQTTWSVLLQGAVWVCGIIAGFLLPPHFVGRIVGETITVENLSRLVQLIVVILIGIFFVLTHKAKRRRSARFWIGSAIVTLVLAVGSYFLYLKLLDAWTCRYAGTRIVIGSDPTPHGADYLQLNSSRRCESWIDDHAGEVEAIWTASSIWWQEIGLLLAYLVAVPLFAFCIMSLLQAVTEGGSRKSRGPAR